MNLIGWSLPTEPSTVTLGLPVSMALAQWICLQEAGTEQPWSHGTDSSDSVQFIYSGNSGFWPEPALWLKTNHSAENSRTTVWLTAPLLMWHCSPAPPLQQENQRRTSTFSSCSRVSAPCWQPTEVLQSDMRQKTVDTWQDVIKQPLLLYFRYFWTFIIYLFISLYFVYFTDKRWLNISL